MQFWLYSWNTALNKPICQDKVEMISITFVKLSFVSIKVKEMQCWFVHYSLKSNELIWMFLYVYFVHTLAIISSMYISFIHSPLFPLCIFRSYTRHYFFFQILKNVQLGKQTNWYLVTTRLFTFTTHWSSPSWWICTKTIRYCFTVHCYGNMPCCYTTFIRQVSDRCCMCLWILPFLIAISGFSNVYITPSTCYC